MQYETIEQARQRFAGKQSPKAQRTQASPLALTFFEELANPTPKPWLIKNVIARGETSSWIAPPGRGKSALLTDIAVHLAEGRDWRGYRTKARCGAVYFALERADLVKRRLTAHRLRDNLPCLPIAVSGEVINLMDESCVGLITDALKGRQIGLNARRGLRSSIPTPKALPPAAATRAQLGTRTSRLQTFGASSTR